MYNVSTNQREDFVLLANQLQKKGPVLGARTVLPRLAPDTVSVSWQPLYI